jgi:hypothetical protein
VVVLIAVTSYRGFEMSTRDIPDPSHSVKARQIRSLLHSLSMQPLHVLLYLHDQLSNEGDSRIVRFRRCSIAVSELLMLG